MRELWEFLFPNHNLCWVCMGRVKRNAGSLFDYNPHFQRICSSCSSRFSRISGHLCLSCGIMLSSKAVFLCRDCKTETSELMLYNRSCVKYCVWTRNILHLYKHKGKESLAKPLGSWIAEIVRQISVYDYKDLDYVTWVPIHEDRLGIRGFNQSKSLAEVVGSCLRLRVRELLSRKFRSTPQSRLSRKERLVALQGAFDLDASLNLRGKSILILDDVYTTGSTLRECAKVFYLAGAKAVRSVTFAR